MHGCLLHLITASSSYSVLQEKQWCESVAEFHGKLSEAKEEAQKKSNVLLVSSLKLSLLP